MSRVFSKKPADDTKLTFKPMGAKPGIQKLSGPAPKKKAKKPAKLNRFAKKAAVALAGM